jgi:hypothetical protein
MAGVLATGKSSLPAEPGLTMKKGYNQYEDISGRRTYG